MRFAVVLVVLVACSDEKFTVEDLQNPETCAQCHPKHYEQWSGSMHAYSAEDPVFVAMNRRGQRDTNGELGDFCVQCHAPMAIQLGLVTGGDFDPAALPPAAKGITCYFCHNVESVTRDHNNGLVLANDQTMRGGVKDPTENPAHFSKYDELMAGQTNNSTMCGSCHDVVTPGGVHIERTFAEWKTTVFALPNPTPDFLLHQTCSTCHMEPSTQVIAEGSGFDVKSRDFQFHEHMWPGVDVALTPFPQIDEQRAAVQKDLDSAVSIVGPRPRGSEFQAGGICVEPVDGGVIRVRIDTPSVGHMFPSGVAEDRRVWLETIAYNASGTVIWSSGIVPPDQDPEEINDSYVNCQMGPEGCSGFWDRNTKADGQPAHFFWEVANVDSKLLLPQTILDENATGYDHSRTVRYLVGPSVFQQVDKIEAKLYIRPLPFVLLDDLIASGDLDPSIRSKVPTFTSKGGSSTWLRATRDSNGCNPF